MSKGALQAEAKQGDHCELQESRPRDANSVCLAAQLHRSKLLEQTEQAAGNCRQPAFFQNPLDNISVPKYNATVRYRSF